MDRGILTERVRTVIRSDTQRELGRETIKPYNMGLPAGRELPGCASAKVKSRL